MSKKMAASEMGFFESLIFNHKLDEDTNLIKRDGINAQVVGTIVAIPLILLIAILEKIPL